MKKVAEHRNYLGTRKANLASIPMAIVLFLLVFGYYLYARGQPMDLMTLNNAMAVSSLLMIGVSYIMGPLARFFNRYVRYVVLRKPFGFWGVGFAVLHIVLSLTLPSYQGFYQNFQISFFTGTLAFALFAFITVTSNLRSIESLGFGRWKKIQRTGYLAMALVLVHFVVLRTMMFQRAWTFPPAALIALVFILVVLALRVIVQVLPKKEVK